MSVFNGGKYVAQAVEGILNQGFKDFEFIIVDDASTDNTAGILERYRDPRIIRISNERNLGISRSLNRGLGLVSSPLTARQDADDPKAPGSALHDS